MPPLITQLLALTYGSHQLANMLEFEHATNWPIHCFKYVAVISTYPFAPTSDCHCHQSRMLQFHLLLDFGFPMIT
jgi:hypothetical protein